MMERLCSHVLTRSPKAASLVEWWKGSKNLAVPVDPPSSSNKPLVDKFKGTVYLLVITAREKIFSS